MDFKEIVEILSSIATAFIIPLLAFFANKHKKNVRERMELEKRLIILETVQNQHREDFKKIEKTLNQIWKAVNKKRRKHG